MIIGLSGKKQHGKDTVCKIIQNLTAPESPDYSTIQDGNIVPIKGVSSWQRKQFSSKLKQVVAILIGCDLNQLEDNKFKEAPLGDEWKKWCLAHYKWDNENNPGGRISGWFNSQDEAEDAKKYLLGGDLAGIASEAYVTAEILTPRRILQLMGTEAGRNIIHPNLWINATLSEYKELHPHTKLAEYPNWIITDVRFPNEAEAIKRKGGLIFRVSRPSMISNDRHPSEISLDNYTNFDGYIVNDGDIEILVTRIKYILQRYKILQ